MIAARDALALYDTRRVRPAALEVVGQHGSLTKAEREVPLLCFPAQGRKGDVAELVFFSGTMDCGKSTLALQMDHNHRARGRGGVRFSRNDRAGGPRISSRLGLETDCRGGPGRHRFLGRSGRTAGPAAFAWTTSSAMKPSSIRRRRWNSWPASWTRSTSTCLLLASPPTSAPGFSRDPSGSSNSPTGSRSCRWKRCAGADAAPPTTPAQSTALWSWKARR